MKVTLCLVLTLTLTCTLPATTPPCHETATFSDTGCSESTDCPITSGTGCTTTSFTALCTCDYALDAWTTCEETNCAHCMSCVAVYEGGTLLATCQTTGCSGGHQGCCRTCGSVALTAGHTYTVTVCLSHCPPGDATCTTCGDPQYNCKAWACLRCETTSAPCYGSLCQ
jgi:hypothetical protein